MSRLVYLAGRFSRRDEFNGYAKTLRVAGFRVDARWLVENHEWYGEHDAAAIEAARGFARDDLEDVARADAVLVFTEPPNPGGRNRGGRHVEFGIALGLGKDIYVVGSPENVFHNLDGLVNVPDPEQMHGGTPALVSHRADFGDALTSLIDRYRPASPDSPAVVEPEPSEP